MRILRNYILDELLHPFLMALVVFTFVMLVGNLVKIVDLVINKGVSAASVGKLFLYLLPYLLSYTIPMSLLTATLMCFSKLSSDNEILAMRTSGISLYRIALPVVTTGLLVSVLCVPLNDRVIPAARFATRQIIKDIGLKNPAAYLEAGTFIREFQGYVIFIHGIRKNKLSNIRIYQPQADGPTRTIVAQSGEFIGYPEQGVVKLRLENGSTDEPDPVNPAKFYKLKFQNYYLTLNLEERIARTNKIEKKPKDMTIAELKTEINQYRAMKIDPAPLSGEIHKKISMSFAALAFVLVAIPLGIRVRRREKSVGFGISVGLITLYWVLLAWAQALCLQGVKPCGLLLWTPNLLLSGLGILLLARAARQ